MITSPTLMCQDKRRRQLVRETGYNGLDYIEVSPDQYTIIIYFLDKAPEELTKENIRITGGRRIRDIQVVDIDLCIREVPELDDCLIVTVDKWGDFSTYTLCLIDLDEDLRFDPRYLCLDFSFKVDCPSDLDCRQEAVCPPEKLEEPELNYLAKDYTSFRQLILDRLALIMPEWKERHVPDIGLALVELLAYVGDHLSYYQDAVATEAYLNTARRRISVRRHARLVDYRMHEGCNARAWLYLKTDQDLLNNIKPEDVYFITGMNDALSLPGRILEPDDLRDIPRRRYEVFEPLLENADKPIPVYTAHNEIYLYTWGNQECCLPKGAIQATLIDGTLQVMDDQDVEQHSDKREQPKPPGENMEFRRDLHLEKGDFLLFEEVIGPETGNKADADPKHRHVVRLTSVKPIKDPLNEQTLLEIEWAEEDALPFPLCISAVGPAPDCTLLDNISVARGNMILVDHGQRVDVEKLGTVTAKQTKQVCEGIDMPSEIEVIAERFEPKRINKPITFSQPLLIKMPASELINQDPRSALPQIWINSQPEPPGHWEIQYDLLDSRAEDRHFVAEMDDQGRAHLRFGNDELGLMPAADTTFFATYRVGNGTAGNVGAEAISHIVFRDESKLDGVNLEPRNPIAATGGIAPEPLAYVKQFAPYAFRSELKRAITAQDYADIVMTKFANKVQRAAATVRWTGSWYEVLVAIDQHSTYEADPELLKEITDYLYLFRRIGHDVVVAAAFYVPLDIKLTVCVKPAYLRGHVKAALLDEFSNRRLPDGRLGFFHSDNLTFGEDVLLSRLVARAQAVTGVESVLATPEYTKLERLLEGPNREVEAGILPLGPFEIARLDNDPSFSENGILKLDLRGRR
ncbi:MAG: putative baseplate assembly protein [Desulfobacteraceae bacterium]|nr:putative baseplate assembly protein [Desulfobacteraceae bacterium]